MAGASDRIEPTFFVRQPVEPSKEPDALQVDDI